MTIHRIEEKNGAQVQRQPLVPGYREKLRSPFAYLGAFFTSSIAEVVVDVVSDDIITITQGVLDTNPYNSRKYREEPRVTELSKHQINEHAIHSPRSLTGKITRFEWAPSRITIPPAEEQAIQQLITDGTYTLEDAEAVRDNLVFERQRQMRSNQ